MPRVSSHFGLKDPRFQSLVFPQCVVTTVATDANLTLTTDQLLCGFMLRSIGAARTDTLPTAALLVEAVQGAMVGTFFDVEIRNSSAGANTLTLAAGAGGTSFGILTIAQKVNSRYRIVFTNVTKGSETYTLHLMSTSTVLP